MTFFTIAAIKEANRALGHHFFDADMMRFFRSRVMPTVYVGGYFLTTEKSCFDDTTRVWSVRLAKDDGSIETIVGGLATKAQALRAMKEHRAGLAKGNAETLNACSKK